MPTSTSSSPKVASSAKKARLSGAPSPSGSPSTSKLSSAPAPATASSSSSPLIDGRVSSAQALKAIKALQSHRKQHKVVQLEKSRTTAKSVLPLDGEDDDTAGAGKTDDMVYLNVTVKRLAKEKKSKPVSIPLPHALNPLSSTEVCLFVKDPQRTYKDLLPTLGVSCIHRIVGVSKLKGKFAPFEARRALMDEFDLFLCDERVAPMMPALLGAKWMQKKKMPVGVNVVRSRHLKEELEKAIGSTRFFTNKGSTMSIPLGSLTHYSPEQILENLFVVLPKVVSKVPFESWKNVQNIEVKTGKSASLPVWNCDLSSRWEGVRDADMIVSPEISEAGSDSQVDENAGPKLAVAAKTKKTKSSTQQESKKGVPKASKVASVSSAKVISDKMGKAKKDKVAATKAKK